MEERNGLEVKAMDQEPHKSIVKELIDEVLTAVHGLAEEETVSAEKEPVKKSPAKTTANEKVPVKKSPAKTTVNEKVPELLDEPTVEPRKSTKMNVTKEDSDVEGVKQPAKKKRVKKESQETKVDAADEPSQFDAKEDKVEEITEQAKDDYSEVEDAESVEKKKRVKKDASDGKSSKPRGAGNEDTLKELKRIVARCGVRKHWVKELEGKNVNQSISHVRQILRDLGMEGRPTLKKAEQVKLQREEQEVLEELAKNEILPDSSKKRRRQAASNGLFRTNDIDEMVDENEPVTDYVPKMKQVIIDDDE